MAKIPEDAKLDMLAEKPIQELTSEELNKLIEREHAKWDLLQISPQSLGHDIFALDAKLKMLVKLLIKLEIINEEEADLEFKREIYVKLRDVRASIEPQIRQAQLTQGILGPNGQLFKP